MDTIKTKLHYYYYTIDDDDQKQEYKALCKFLKSQGLELFDSISSDHHRWYKDAIKPLDDTVIELETNYLFDNQWNTAPCATSETGLRVFDWAEAIYPNKYVKQGQWLEQTDEMIYIRSNRVKCGYCGKQYTLQQGYVFCDACLDSEYLKENDLRLLRVMPLGTDKRPPLTRAEYDWLLPQYIDAQTRGNDERRTKKIEKQYARIEKEYLKSSDASRTEYMGFKWLLDHGVNIDNCIFYNHKSEFCFGWRQALSDNVASALLDVLAEFPYEYTIKQEN